MCKINICTIEGCQDNIKAKGMCNKHYIMSKRGKLDSVTSTEAKKEKLKEIAESANYSLTKSIKNVGKTKRIVVTAFDNGTQSIIDKSCDFTTKDGNMKIKQLMSKECLQDYVDPQYYVYASLIVSWALNSKDCIIRNPRVDNRLVANDMMIKDMFTSYAPKRIMADRKYKEIIAHLVERNIIYKTTRVTPLSKETIIYLANPLFVPSVLNELSPELFLSFHDMLATRIDGRTMNEMFGLALKSICWSSECEALMIKGNKENAYTVLISNLKDTVRTLGLSSRVVIIENEMDFLINALGAKETVAEEIEEDMNDTEDILEIAHKEDVKVELTIPTSRRTLSEAMKEKSKNRKPNLEVKVGNKPSFMTKPINVNNDESIDYETMATYM